MEKIKTIFIGTPAFAIPALKTLLEDDYFDIIAVVTQPDKKAGRKQIITPPPIKLEAQKNNILVLQPERIKNFVPQISELKPDLIILAAYAQIIPESILEIPKYGAINIHGSLLPKYRGASCVQGAILEGDSETGATIMKMDKGLDTGPILAQSRVEISSEDTAESLLVKISEAGAEILPAVLKKYISGEIKPEVQDDSRANYVGILKKEDGKINWIDQAEKIERFIRAMSPWPSAFTSLELKGKSLKLKVLEAENKILDINKYKIGELFLDNKDLAVQCGQGALIIKRLQLEGKKETSVEEFLRGHQDLIGKILN